MRVAALISGGKDSALALHRAQQQGHTVTVLVAMIPLKADSWMFHYPNIHLTALFAEAADIRLIQQKTAGTKEKELDDLRTVLTGLDVDGVVSGAVASRYQQRRIQKICEDLGFTSIMPLWKQNPRQLLQEIVDSEFTVIVTGVYAYGFDARWLGRELDDDAIDALVELNRKYGISLVGEGGEYETLVLDAPFFKKTIDVTETQTIWDDHSGWLFVKKARLVRKKRTHA
jgi:diphthine-ammonia ligase